VLYIEEDPTTLEAIASILREGFEVWVARNSEEALEVAAEIAYSADVLVIDLALGITFRGDSFIAEYRRRAHREVPVIIVSRAPRGYDIAKSIRGATFVAKPIDVLGLVRAIRVAGHRERSMATSSASRAA
jgi:DNA-binding response OmpR family regulator